MAELRDGAPRVVVAGGGIAGLETLLALTTSPGIGSDFTLIAPDPDFTYRPLIVEEPFSFQPAERHELRPIADRARRRAHSRRARPSIPCADRSRLADGSAGRLRHRSSSASAPGNVPPSRTATTFQSAGESLELADAAGRARAATATRSPSSSRRRILAAADLRAGADDRACGAPPQSPRHPHRDRTRRRTAPLIIFGTGQARRSPCCSRRAESRCGRRTA